MKSEIKNDVDTIVEYLDDQKCKDVNVIDVENRCSWADVLIIATVNSVGHLRGVSHNLWGILNDLGLEVNDRHKTPAGDGWELIDCNSIVIHLMSEELREFYSLEKLWKETEN
jgi:ribosome-associated protein